MLPVAAIRSWFATQGWETDPAAAGWDQHRRARWAWRKYRKAQWWARVLAWVPGVRMIAIGNALGYGNCRDDSDIDLVIITAPRRIWIARFLVVALLKLFRQRPGEHGRILSPSSRGGVGGGVPTSVDVHIRDALCPSFFLTTDALNLEPLQLPARKLEIGNWKLEIPQDPYLLFWPTHLTVLYDHDGTYARFWDANAAWVRRWLSDATSRYAHPRFVWSRKPLTQFWTAVQNCVTMFFDPMGDRVERWAKRVQEPRLRRLFPQANSDTSVVIRDDMLKFHSNDRRAEFRERWVTAMT